MLNQEWGAIWEKKSAMRQEKISKKKNTFSVISNLIAIAVLKKTRYARLSFTVSGEVLEHDPLPWLDTAHEDRIFSFR